MNKFIAFAIFFSFVVVSAQSDQEISLRANFAYKNKEFIPALDLYKQVSNKSASVWYNLGNSYYQINDDINALLAWKRAEVFGGREEAALARYNLDLVQEELGALEVGQKNFFGLLGINCLEFSILTLQLLVLFLSLILILFLLLVRKRLKRKKFLPVFVLFLSMVISLVIAVRVLYLRNSFKDKKHALVKKDTSLVIGPGAEYHQIGTTKKGKFVTINQVKNNWYRVSVDTDEGWVSKTSLLLV